MQTKQIRIRLDHDEISRLETLAGEYHLQHGAALASILVKAGLEAIAANNGRLSLPPQFQILTGGTTDYRLNEPKPHNPKTRK